MDCLDAIRTRRTVRRYNKEPVEFEKVMAICEAGAMAPSSGNIQNWIFILCRDKDKIKTDLYHACMEQEGIQTAQVAIIVCSDDAMAERHYGLRGQRLYAPQNCAAAIQNMLLTAHCLGLGAAWIGAFNEDRIRAIYQIPGHTGRPQAIITLGYPAEAPGEKRMRHIDDVVRFETYTMRYRDIHRVIRDISVEIAKQKRELKERIEDKAPDLLKKAKEFIAKNFRKGEEQKKLTDHQTKKEKKEQDPEEEEEDKKNNNHEGGYDLWTG